MKNVPFCFSVNYDYLNALIITHWWFFFFLSALLSIPAQQFKLVLDSIVWAFKHTMRNVADIGMSQVFVGWLKILSVLCVGT